MGGWMGGPGEEPLMVCAHKLVLKNWRQRSEQRRRSEDEGKLLNDG